MKPTGCPRKNYMYPIQAIRLFYILRYNHLQWSRILPDPIGLVVGFFNLDISMKTKIKLQHQT